MTCIACPEQYDAFVNSENVAYLRLRHGHFTVDVPFGNTVYTANPEGDGAFDDDERDFYLMEAAKIIQKELGNDDDEVTYSTQDVEWITLDASSRS